MKDKQDCSSPSFYALIIKILIWLSTIIICVFVILPMFFILLGNVFPEFISTDGALTQLNNGMNALVGYCSLAVGFCSILYARLSNHRVDEQQHKNEEFLKQLADKIDCLQESNTALYDQVVNNQHKDTKKDNSR